ncbi:prepilin peptidase [Paenibacillus oryzisoli]|uniref:Prepilin type IV endopeptidase peptidase domain-containing protein n=1 Tax=Paenibacillus oryzisoli TaxID=1850517 RepID=A0A198A4W2_9BACL|nr:A24 family peptidase [Paenibacillus oryzisoli]OAS16033.1 hypothetical protein A8708_05495 [Paenibacillus oryzisoli]
MSSVVFFIGILFGLVFNKVAFKIIEQKKEDSGSRRSKFLCLFSGLMTGLLYLCVYLKFGVDLQFLIGLLLASLSVIIAHTDIFVLIIPNKVLVVFLPIFIGLRLLYNPEGWWNYPLGAFTGAGFVLLIIFLTRGGMGMGDAKLLFVYGWAIGLDHTIIALIVASILSSIVSILLLLLKILKKKQLIPFGPFLGIGTLVAFFFGTELISAYWHY